MLAGIRQGNRLRCADWLGNLEATPDRLTRLIARMAEFGNGRKSAAYCSHEQGQGSKSEQDEKCKCDRHGANVPRAIPTSPRPGDVCDPALVGSLEDNNPIGRKSLNRGKAMYG